MRLIRALRYFHSEPKDSERELSLLDRVVEFLLSRLDSVPVPDHPHDSSRWFVRVQEFPRQEASSTDHLSLVLEKESPRLIDCS